MLKLDWWLFLPALFLSFLGLLIVFSAAPTEVFQQAIFLSIGLGLFFLVVLIDRSFWISLAPFWYGLSFLLLATVFGFGAVSRGSTRWLNLGLFRFQPSEVTKPFFALAFSWLAAKFDNFSLKEMSVLIVSFLVPFLLIFRQPDLGSAVVLGSLWLGVLMAGKIHLKVLAPFILVVLVGLPIIWTSLKPYQQTRVKTFLNPQLDPLGASYNQIQAMIAIGSGGFLGKGLGKGSQVQLEFLPEHQTDFIFATFAEEFGFVGALGLLGLYSLLLFRILKLAMQTEDLIGRLATMGIFTYLGFQIVAHIAINLGLLPVTGITLPFLSVGGSSLVASWVSLGIVQALTDSKRQRETFTLA